MKNQRAFTLIELAVTVAVVLIVSLIALPSMRSFILNYRSTSQANEFAGSLNLARSEALKRQRPGIVLANSGGTSGNEFGNGWTVFSDANGNGTLDAGEAISTSDALVAGGTLSDQQSLGKVEFKLDGTVGVARTFASKVAGCTGQQARTITISRVGRVRATKVSCT